MSSNYDKYKRLKQKRLKTTNPETTTSKPTRPGSEDKPPDPIFPLQAKDSEWVDILQSNQLDRLRRSTNSSDEEEMLQIVECEDGPQIKPLAILFPGLLNEDPQTLHGMLNKAMSTTEVTRHLVNLGEKANFTFMKKADRLIPRDKKWLESLTENSNSFCSINSGSLSESVSSEYDSVKGIDNFKMNSKIIYEQKTVNITNSVLPDQNEHIIKDANRQVYEEDKKGAFGKPSSAAGVPK